MATLTKKIDFAAIICVNNANPNGDPLNGNRPRTTYDNLGEISDVAIKRKIRNRLQDMNYPIFVQSEDNKVDNYPSLRARAEIVLKDFDPNDKKKYQEVAFRFQFVGLSLFILHSQLLQCLTEFQVSRLLKVLVMKQRVNVALTQWA